MTTIVQTASKHRDARRPQAILFPLMRGTAHPATAYAAACSLAALLLSGCTSMPPMPQAPANPAPGSGFSVSLEPYRVQVGDVLQIRLPLTPEFNDEVTVRPDGHISTSLVADAPAYDMTVPQLTAALREDYTRDLRNPHLTVIVKSFAPYRIYVAGEVAIPGEYLSPQGPNLTLSQALARAGGLRPSGDPGKVFILRRGPNDMPEVFATRYADVMHGADPAGDVRLARYDVVYVPKSSIAELYIFFNQYLQQFMPVSWGFSYLVNPGPTNVVQAPSATITK